MTMSDESYFQRNIIVEPCFMKMTVFFLTAKLGTTLRVWDLGQNVEYNMIITCLVIILPLHKLPLLCMTEPCYDASVVALYIEYIWKYLTHDSKHFFLSMRFSTCMMYTE
jgi:hypothetical protein